MVTSACTPHPPVLRHSGSQEISKQIFNGVLQRKDRADATRTTLALLQRFKFLFQLPGSIRENIRRQQYNLVINDYLRAKALFSTTEVETFKKGNSELKASFRSFRIFLLRIVTSCQCTYVLSLKFKQIALLPSSVRGGGEHHRWLQGRTESSALTNAFRF